MIQDCNLLLPNAFETKHHSPALIILELFSVMCDIRKNR